MTPGANFVREHVSSLQRRTQHPRIGADRQRIAILHGRICEPAGQHRPAARAITLGKGFGAPSRCAAARARLDPDLEQRRRVGLNVIFGMADARRGAHDLNITSLGSPLVTHRIFVSDSPRTDVCYDFHVAVRVRREPGIWGDFIVVPHQDAAPTHPSEITIRAERKMVVRVEPAVVGRAERRKPADVNEVRIADGMSSHRTCFRQS